MTIIGISGVVRTAALTESGEAIPAVVVAAAPYAPRGPIIFGASSSSVELGTGPRTFITQYGLGFSPGMRVRASVPPTPIAWMEGIVTSYEGNVLLVNITLTSGLVATYNIWQINVAGEPGMTGPAGPPGAGGSPGPAGGPGYLATSTVTLTIATGTQSITTQANLAYSAGARARVAAQTDIMKWMEGRVTSYSGTSLVINVDLVSGSGSFTGWNINLAGAQGTQGIQGVQGLQGNQGVQGVQGVQGTTGDPGPQGTQGIEGPQGPPGDPGGPIGPEGPQGPQGEVGPLGPPGPQGEIGPIGPQGVQGPSGSGVVQSVTAPLVVDGGGVLSLPDNSVVNAKLVNVPQYTFHARLTAGSGPIETPTFAQVIAAINTQKSGCHITLTTDQTGIANETWTKVAFANSVFNDGVRYNTSTQRWVPPAGKHSIVANVYFSVGLLVGTPIFLAIYKNGALFKLAQGSAMAFYSAAMITILDTANGTDYYEVFASVMTSGTATISSAAANTYLMACQA